MVNEYDDYDVTIKITKKKLIKVWETKLKKDTTTTK